MKKNLGICGMHEFGSVFIHKYVNKAYAYYVVKFMLKKAHNNIRSMRLFEIIITTVYGRLELCQK